MNDMKKVAFLIVLASMLLAGGCDMLRKVAGRPTSEDIRSRRLEILAYEMRRDSLKQRQQELSDSLATEDSLRQAEVRVRPVGEVGELIYSDPLDSRYYIIVGAFRDSRNFENMLKTVSDEGYIPARFVFSGGLQAVGVCPTNSLKQAGYALKGVKREDFCPPDVWILVNK